MVSERVGKTASAKGKKRPSVILFGHHFALFLPSFLPVIHLVTTKKWDKMDYLMTNHIKLYQRQKPGKP